MHITRMGILAFLLSAGLATSSSRAEDTGLDHLDEAVEIKLFARSEADLNRVVSLCEQAIEDGLNAENEEFARKLWTSTLYQHAEALCRNVLDILEKRQSQPLDPRALNFARLALPKLEKAVEVDREFSDAHFLIARLHGLPGGDQQRAAEAIEKVIQLSEDNPHRRAEALVLRGDMARDDEQKLADYNKALQVESDNVKALRHRALFYLRRDENEKALADFARIHEDDADNLEAYHGVVEALTNLKRFDEAHRQLDKAAEIDPSSSFNFTLRARIHTLQDKVPQAISALSEALRLDDRDIRALIMRAQLHQSAGDLNRAKHDLERALLVQPGLVPAIMMRSMISAAQGDYIAAESDLQDLLRSDPDNIQWRLRLAAVYTLDKRPRKAIEIYSGILRNNPVNVSALRGRADALLSVGRQADALKDYETALAQDPDDKSILNNLAWLLATSPEESLRDGKRSIELGLRACEVTDYKEPHILSTLAAGYAEMGDFETAIKWSTEAVRLGEGEQKSDLEKELESYRRGEPWREIQHTEEKPEPTRGGGNFPF